jgi:hypothetical protein
MNTVTPEDTSTPSQNHYLTESVHQKVRQIKQLVSSRQTLWLSGTSSSQISSHLWTLSLLWVTSAHITGYQSTDICCITLFWSQVRWKDWCDHWVHDGLPPEGISRTSTKWSNNNIWQFYTTYCMPGPDYWVSQEVHVLYSVRHYNTKYTIRNCLLTLTATLGNTVVIPILETNTRNTKNAFFTQSGP